MYCCSSIFDLRSSVCMYVRVCVWDYCSADHILSNAVCNFHCSRLVFKLEYSFKRKESSALSFLGDSKTK